MEEEKISDKVKDTYDSYKKDKPFTEQYSFGNAMKRKANNSINNINNNAKNAKNNNQASNPNLNNRLSNGHKNQDSNLSNYQNRKPSSNSINKRSMNPIKNGYNALRNRARNNNDDNNSNFGGLKQKTGGMMPGFLPGVTYANRVANAKQKRASQGLSPESPMVYIQALSPITKILIGMGALGFFFLIFFVAMIVNNVSQNNLYKQIIGVASTIIPSSDPVKNKRDDKNVNPTIQSHMGNKIAYQYNDIGNIFTNGNKCSGDECNNRAELLYYQKIHDISYRYKKLYNIDLDWPLIIAANMINSREDISSFEDNLNGYNYSDVQDLTKTMNLDWDYDYKNLSDYDYLASNDGRYDLQILAKNLVKKTTTQKCMNGVSVMTSKVSYDLENKYFEKDQPEYLKCGTGTYSIKHEYEIDEEKFDEFLLEYLDRKLYGPSSTKERTDSRFNNDSSYVTIPGGDSTAGVMVNLARSQIGTSDKAKFWQYMGFNSRVPWCASFVSWVNANTVYDGKKLYPDIIKTKTASAAGFMLYFIKASDGNIRFHYNSDCGKYAGKGDNYTPKPGDLIFFDWQQSWNGDFNRIAVGNGVIDHIGIVEGVSGGRVNTVEGNSSDSVRERSYNRNNCQVVGYGSWY